jgi:hypothetical protein
MPLEGQLKNSGEQTGEDHCRGQQNGDQHEEGRRPGSDAAKH